MVNSQKCLIQTSVRLLCAQISKELQNKLKQFENKKHEKGGSGNGFQDVIRWALVNDY